MRKLTLTFFALSLPTVACAQGLPNWNVDQYCAKRGQKSGMTSELIAGCVDAERASLAELKEAWNGYAAASREKCLSQADQHYADLQACIIAAEAPLHTLPK